MTATTGRKYRPTESKYKGGADEMYVTYDVKRKTRSGEERRSPKVKRVYIAGKVKDWEAGNFKKRTGRAVHGVVIQYEQGRSAYQRGSAGSSNKTVSVHRTSQTFRKVVEVPKDAQNVHFYRSAQKLPARYKSAMQTIK